MKRQPGYAVRRVAQTITEFSNGPRVLAGLVQHRVTGRPAELTYRFRDGRTMTCPNVSGARLPIYEVLVDDTYRLPWIAGGLGPDPVVLDIGAHIGGFALAVQRLHPEAAVHCFEASATTAAYLRRNVAGNALASRVHVHNVAVAGHTGHIDFIDNGSGSVHNGMDSPEQAAPQQVPCVTFAEAAALAGDRIDLVKIDAEGAEYDFILKSRPEDWAPVRRVVMEYHNVRGHAWDELEAFFADTSLRVVRRDAHSDRLGLVWLSRDPLA